MKENPRMITRSEQNPASCWSIEDLFPSDEAWYAALEACKDIPAQAETFKGRLGASAADLLAYLKAEEEINECLDSLFIYPMLRKDEDNGSSKAQAMSGRCQDFRLKLSKASAYAMPEINAIPEETLEQFYRDEPALEPYRRYLTRARRSRDHVLSQAEEDILVATGRLSGGPSQIYNTLRNADLKFPDALDSAGKPHPVSNGSYVPLSTSRDRTLRANAFRSLYDTYGSLRNGFAAMYNASVQKDVFYAQVRRYDSFIQSAMYPSEIPETVYFNLVDTVHKNLEPMYRYLRLRKKALGLEELHLYDCSVPILPEADQVIPFDTAKAYVLEATKVLGQEYHDVLASAFENRWMDIYENQGKTAGAYSAGCRVHPFVLLNHKDDLRSAFTVAHEMGHAMHSYLSTRNQPTLYQRYVTFVAEVASTCNEMLLTRYLLRQCADKKQRAVLINYFLDQFRNTLYRQTMLAEFEEKTHALVEQGESLTVERLCGIHKDLVGLYFGPDVVLDPGIEMEWARIPHFYRKFYVYQYATGFSAAVALSQRILNGGPETVQDYLGFLSGGCSKDPIALLRGAGVDMATPAPVQTALDLFASLVDEMEQLLA